MVNRGFVLQYVFEINLPGRTERINAFVQGCRRLC